MLQNLRSNNVCMMHDAYIYSVSNFISYQIVKAVLSVCSQQAFSLLSLSFRFCEHWNFIYGAALSSSSSVFSSRM